ncbi:nuclear transport factor 2 family protein [uncultured Paraglaciecola sp.]|uniref:YybH family protein n=1 Tax=uncultured Paraglaciecola sp. TaxID=1765024 RepID=UPI0030DD9F78|tara:strand:- start:4763 stop:5251 length:489 start_codon:yes stop_codon:yes gene_type:complete
MAQNVLNNSLIAGAVIFYASFSAITYAHGNEVHETNESMFAGLELAPAKTVMAFHRALQQNNKIAARATLADDVLIFEGGVERSADEYANHHMLADMKFLSHMTSTLLEQQVYKMGDLAYSVARKRTQGEYKDKILDYIGFETIVLKKVHNVWKITHIHWSK